MTINEELRDEAVAFLTERGHDVPARDAVVEAAETVAFNECVANEAPTAGVFNIAFDGAENCGYDGDCGGWDGVSNRCECGNRRVYWETSYGTTFKNMYIMAMAD